MLCVKVADKIDETEPAAAGVDASELAEKIRSLALPVRNQYCVKLCIEVHTCIGNLNLDQQWTFST